MKLDVTIVNMGNIKAILCQIERGNELDFR